MSQLAIADAIYSRLNANSLSVPYYTPNEEGDTGGTPQPPAGSHIIVSVLPSTTAAIGLTETDQLQGLIQFSIYVPKGEGELDALRIASEICTLFPRNLQLDAFRIDRAGSVAPAFFEGKFQITPVNIPYQKIM